MPTLKKLNQRRKKALQNVWNLKSDQREFTLTADDGVTFEFKEGADGALPKFHVLAYTGKVVEKYGMCLVINIAGLRFKDVVPFIADHDPSLRIGHGKITVANNKIAFDGDISSTSETAKQFIADSKNGFPFEASVGVKSQSTRYIPEKQKVNVNGAELVGPLVVIEKGLLREVSGLTLGADDETSSTALSAFKGAKPKMKTLLSYALEEYGFDQEGFEELSDKAKAKIEADFKKLGDKKTKQLDPNLGDDHEDEDEDGDGKQMFFKQEDFHRWSAVMEMTNGNHSLAREAIDRGLSDEEIKDKLDLQELRSSRGKMPNPKKSDDARTKELKILTCRLMSGLRIQADQKKVSFSEGDILNRYVKDEQIVDSALEQGSIGLRESIAMFANMHPKSPGNFTCYGVSDTTEAMQFLSYQNQQAFNGVSFGNSNDLTKLSFNSGMMPNAFQSMTRIAMMERLRIAPQVTPALFAKGENSNLLPTPRMRVNAGEKWKQLGNDGKLRYLGFGEEEFYQTWLCTRGGILTFKEDDAINDNMGMIEQIIAATVEMGDTEDWEFFMDFYNSPDETGPTAFWTEQNSISGGPAVLDYTDPETSYTNMKAAMARIGKQQVGKGDDLHNVSTGNSFVLLHGENLDFDVFSLFVDTTDANDASINTWRAWFRGKIRPVKCIDMDNEALYGEQAGGKNWALINTNTSVAPYENTTLRGSRGARVESIALPPDCLGFGTRFWKRSRLNRLNPIGILRAKP